MTGWDLLGLWSFEPPVVGGLVGLAAGYAVLVRGRPDRRAWWMAGALAVLIVALLSPIDALGEHYLFSAHMLEHILIDFVAPPMILKSLPPDRLRRLLELRPLAAVERVIRRPVVAWVVGVGTLWLWHVPALYEAALASDAVHGLQHACFLASGLLLWWPVTSPLEGSRLAPAGRVLLLFAAAAANALLGILITFAPLGLYPTYLAPEDELGLEPLLQGRWHLSPAFDQQLGGLLMWVLGAFIFLTAVLVALADWFREGGPDGEHAVARREGA